MKPIFLILMIGTTGLLTACHAGTTGSHSYCHKLSTKINSYDHGGTTQRINAAQRARWAQEYQSFDCENQ